MCVYGGDWVGVHVRLVSGGDWVGVCVGGEGGMGGMLPVWVG